MCSSDLGSKSVANKFIEHTSTNRNWVSITCNSGGTKLVAVVGTGLIYTSTDSAQEWTSRASAKNWISVSSNASGNDLVAIDFGKKVYYSSNNGENWTAR